MKGEKHGGPSLSQFNWEMMEWGGASLHHFSIDGKRSGRRRQQSRNMFLAMMICLFPFEPLWCLFRSQVPRATENTKLKSGMNKLNFKQHIHNRYLHAASRGYMPSADSGPCQSNPTFSSSCTAVSLNQYSCTVHLLLHHAAFQK